jgi:hypothetical protein
LQLLKRKRRAKKRREAQESTEAAPPLRSGLAVLQQTIGNRAVQRMLVEDAQKSDPAVVKLTQRQAEEAEASDSDSDRSEEFVANVTEQGLSSVELLEKFKPSEELSDLDSDFRRSVEAFIEALEQGGAKVEILATVWPPELAYLLHWAWQIAKEGLHPLAAPPIEEIDFNAEVKPEVDINWWHGSLEASRAVAEEIVEAAGIGNLDEPPVLASHHVAGEAIDMKISWGGELLIQDPLGGEVIIFSSPKDETNPDLIELATLYGIIHYEDVDKDPVHWSIDGA